MTFNRLRFIHGAALGLTIAGGSLLGGCSKDEPFTPAITRADKGGVLIYAVASNSLDTYFPADMAEIERTLPNLDLSKGELWVYSVLPNSKPTLKKLTAAPDGSAEWKLVKEYDRNQFSTDPKRISGVISDYMELCDADTHGLILWSHAASWSPAFSDHAVPQSRSSVTVADGYYQPTENQWFGQDKHNGVSDYCDLIELEEAIPDNTFDFIWFDCCYMSAIEVLYQFRDKTPYIVGCPTEVNALGMPYDVTMPHLLKKDFNLVGAAKAMAETYLNDNAVMTIAVIDTSALEDVAAIAEKAVTGERVSPSKLQKYSRQSYAFYDFGQYTRTWGESLGDEWSTPEFNAAMDRMVVYKAASARDFNGREIKPENFSGVSCHYFYALTDDPKTEYYKSLDWFKRVYPRFPGL